MSKGIGDLMPKIIKTRGQKESYNLNGNMNQYYAPGDGYCASEKDNIITEVSYNLMKKMYDRSTYSIRMIDASWQMSK